MGINSHRILRKLPRLCAVAVFFMLVSLPAITQVAGWEPKNGYTENRVLANPPNRPTSKVDMVKFFSGTDAWLNDHFGLRQTMVAWNNWLRYELLGEALSPQITVGNQGYIYFNSHSADYPLEMIRHICGIGISSDLPQRQSEHLSKMFSNLLAINPLSTLLIVPTKPAIYQEHLPEWLQAQCRNSNPPIPAIVAKLKESPDIAPHIAFPMQQMLELKTVMEVYPKTNFHWTGEGPHRIAEYFGGTTLGLKKLIDLPRQAEWEPSDLQKFLPGVPLNHLALLADYSSAGITPCRGGGCFPELNGAGEKLADISRYRHTKLSGPRLLIISDSFGADIAGYFSEYFGEVWHLCTNNMASLTPEEVNRLKELAFHTYAPDQVIYIYHDNQIGHFYEYLFESLSKLL